MTRQAVASLLLFLWLASPPVGYAGDLRQELTDAILDVDPRRPLTSGRGAAFDSVYSPPDDAPTLTQTPTLRGTYRNKYGQAPKSLRDPRYEANEETLSSAEDDPFAPLIEAPIPLGKPYQRDGVFYQDDLAR